MRLCLTTTWINQKIQAAAAWHRRHWLLARQMFFADGRRSNEVQTHKIHQTIAATRQTEVRKFLASLS